MIEGKCCCRFFIIVFFDDLLKASHLNSTVDYIDRKENGIRKMKIMEYMHLQDACDHGLYLFSLENYIYMCYSCFIFIFFERGKRKNLCHRIFESMGNMNLHSRGF